MRNDAERCLDDRRERFAQVVVGNFEFLDVVSWQPLQNSTLTRHYENLMLPVLNETESIALIIS